MAEPSVRRATPMDDPATVVRAAFGAEEGPRVAALWDELSLSPWLRASLVTEDAEATVGHVGLSHAWVDARRRLVEVWVLSPLSVHPEVQGRGVGSSLLGAAVEVARASGVPYLVLEGDPAFYGARGFVPGSSYGVEPATVRTPAPALQTVAFESREDWMTGRVVYPDLWWRHDAAGLRDPRLAEVERHLHRS